MSKKLISKVSLFLIVFVILAMVTGCGSARDNNNGTGQSIKASGDATTTSGAADSGKITDKPITLTYFAPFGDKASQIITSNSEIVIYPLIEEKTGINIEWIHPPVGQESEQFNLLVASQDLPDIIFYDWINVPGGPAKAIADGTIIKLNDLAEQNAPNFSKMLGNNELKKQAVLDDGSLYMFPVIRDDASVRVWYGPQIRKDWLDKFNLSVPATIDEWYTALKAFKENDANGNGDPNDEIPFAAAGVSGLTSFMGGWGMVGFEFYKDGDKVGFGPADLKFKDYVATMKKWYDEGLIDPDFAATDGASLKAMISDNKAGSYFGSLAGYLGRFSTLLRQQNEQYNLVGAPNPSGADGKPYQIQPQHIRIIPGFGAAITSKNKYPAESAKWLDYHYSEEGHMYMNFGIEGESYTMVDGYPRFTDLIMKNPDGLTFDIAMSKYLMAINSQEVMVHDPRQFEQMSLGTEVQREANALWKSGDDSRLMPPVTYTTEESSEVSMIMNEVSTYLSEMFVKFIMGQEPMENFDKYYDNIKKMKIDRAIEITQAALDRYNTR